MLTFRLHGARAMHGLVLAAYFFFYATLTPSFHTCRPLAVGSARWSAADFPASHGNKRHSVASAQEMVSGNAVEPDHICFACLCTGQLRSLSPPGHVGLPAVAPVLAIPPEPHHARLPSHTLLRLGPRAPPANTLS